MEGERIRRRQYLIKKPKFQLKYAGFNLIVMLLACLVFGLIVYRSGTIMISEISRMGLAHFTVSIMLCCRSNLNSGIC